MNAQGGEERITEKSLETVLKEHTEELMSLEGVVGTFQSLCGGEPCIKVLVKKRSPELEKKIPRFLEGYPVVVQESGEIEAR
jgi:hypothetical protein